MVSNVCRERCGAKGERNAYYASTEVMFLRFAFGYDFLEVVLSSKVLVYFGIVWGTNGMVWCVGDVVVESVSSTMWNLRGCADSRVGAVECVSAVSS